MLYWIYTTVIRPILLYASWTERTNILVEVTSKLPSLSKPKDKICTTFKFDKNFEISVPPKEDWFNGVLPPEHGNVIYTDGSFKNDSAGAGIFCEGLNLNESSPLGQDSSIFLAEMLAILKSSEIILDKRVKDEIIFICSDSKAALKALSSVVFKSALTLKPYRTYLYQTE